MWKWLERVFLSLVWLDYDWIYWKGRDFDSLSGWDVVDRVSVGWGRWVFGAEFVLSTFSIPFETVFCGRV